MQAQGSFNTAQPRVSQPRIRLSLKERTAYPALLARADPSNTSRVEGKAAVEFFRRSALPFDTLKEVWTLAAAGEGFLDRERFFVAMRLIALAQHGHPVTNESLLNVPEVDLPQFDQIAGTVPAAGTDVFAISQTDKVKYEQIFATQTQGKAALGAQEAKALFDKAGVAPSELTKVWSLADPQDTGVLSKNQFFVAMQLLIKAKNGVRIPDALPASLSALVGAHVKASSLPLQPSMPQPSPAKPIPEPSRMVESPPPLQFKPEPSADPAILLDLMRIVKALDSRIDSLSFDFKATKAEIASLRDAQSLQIDASNREFKRYFEQTQALIEAIPRQIKQPAELEDNSAIWRSGISEELGNLTGEMGNLKGEMGGLKREFGDFKGEIGGLKGEMGGLKRELGDFKGELREIKGMLGDWKRETVLMQTNIGQVQGEMKGFRGDIAALQQEFSTVQSTIREDISQVINDSEVIKQGFAAFQAQFRSLATDNESIPSVLASVHTSIQGLKDDLASIPQPDFSNLQAEWSQISQNLDITRQEGKETATLVRELCENMHQIADDFAGFRAAAGPRPAARLEDSEDQSDHSELQEDLLAKADPNPQTHEEAKEPPKAPFKSFKSQFEMPEFPEKQTGFIDEFEAGLAQADPDPKEGFDFDLPPAHADQNKEDFDFEMPENPKLHDFMFDEMMQGARKSPAHSPHDFHFSHPQNPEFVFDSPQEQPEKGNFAFDFDGEKPKEGFQFEEPSPENKDFF
jgi:hypothetical protein